MDKFFPPKKATQPTTGGVTKKRRTNWQPANRLRPGGAAYDRPGKKKSQPHDQDKWEKALKHHLTRSPTVLNSGLFTPYKQVKGYYDLAYAHVEGQSDGAHSHWNENDMTRISWKAANSITKHDKKIADVCWATALDMANGLPIKNDRGGSPVKSQLKWLLPHDHTFSELATKELKDGGLWPQSRQDMNPVGYKYAFDQKKRQLRKKESERIGQYLLDHYTNTGEVREFLDNARANGYRDHIHDMTDALLMAIQAALFLWYLHAKDVLGNRAPREDRPGFPCLTPEQSNGGGTIRVLGVDPGTSNLGLCLVELVEMQSVPQDRLTTPIIEGYTWTPGHPEPCIRILLWELINLDAPWSDMQGQAALSFRPALGKDAAVMRPDYLVEYHKLEHLFYPNKGERGTKRKRAAEVGKGKRTKKLKKLDGTAVETAHSVIDWGELDIVVPGVGEKADEKPEIVCIDLTEDHMS